jgi:hypothetical protein
MTMRISRRANLHLLPRLAVSFVPHSINLVLNFAVCEVHALRFLLFEIIFDELINNYLFH